MYQCKKALRLNIAVNCSPILLNSSWIAVLLPMNVEDILSPRGGTSQTAVLTLFGIHSTKYELGRKIPRNRKNIFHQILPNWIKGELSHICRSLSQSFNCVSWKSVLRYILSARTKFLTFLRQSLSLLTPPLASLLVPLTLHLYPRDGERHCENDPGTSYHRGGGGGMFSEFLGRSHGFHGEQKGDQ